MLSNSESRIEGGPVVSTEAPRNQKKEGRPRESCESSKKMSWTKDTLDPQLTELSDKNKGRDIRFSINFVGEVVV